MRVGRWLVAGLIACAAGAALLTSATTEAQLSTTLSGGAGIGATCARNADCASKLFCQKPTGDCKAEAGVCVSPHQLCDNAAARADQVMVCSCDSRTFNNVCESMFAGISVTSTGACVGGGERLDAGGSVTCTGFFGDWTANRGTCELTPDNQLQIRLGKINDLSSQFHVTLRGFTGEPRAYLATYASPEEHAVAIRARRDGGVQGDTQVLSTQVSANPKVDCTVFVGKNRLANVEAGTGVTTPVPITVTCPNGLRLNAQNLCSMTTTTWNYVLDCTRVTHN